MKRRIDFHTSDFEGLHATGERDTPRTHLGEKHFSVAELSELWNLSRDSIRRLFENEPGVLVFTGIRTHKRTYKTLRIPENVALRVYRTNLVVK
jgi:hypothetical protein